MTAAWEEEHRSFTFGNTACGGYQRQREERLRGLALRVAEEVARQGGSRTLRPMNPADRCIVHLTLADDPEVETESLGNGYFKRGSIRPL